MGRPLFFLPRGLADCLLLVFNVGKLYQEGGNILIRKTRPRQVARRHFSEFRIWHFPSRNLPNSGTFSDRPRLSPNSFQPLSRVPMESSFTKFPAPVGDTETSWTDSADFEKEYSKKWTGDEKLNLPPRTSKARFPHVPDYHDADFDISSAEGTQITPLRVPRSS